MRTNEMPAYFKAAFDKYKYILLVCLVGVVLLLWPGEKGAAEEPVKPADQRETVQLETRLQLLLEATEGVGKALVLLTEEIGPETSYAVDQTDSKNQSGTGFSTTSQQELVTVSQNGGQSPVPLWVSASLYRGAAVICEGGDRADVRLTVTQIVQSLTGLSADRIIISKMK